MLLASLLTHVFNREEHDWVSDDEQSAVSGHFRKIKEWKKTQHELRREHRGIWQVKPARTALWMKDGMKKVRHKARKSLTKNAREPGVETEA